MNTLVNCVKTETHPSDVLPQLQELFTNNVKCYWLLINCEQKAKLFKKKYIDLYHG